MQVARLGREILCTGGCVTRRPRRATDPLYRESPSVTRPFVSATPWRAPEGPSPLRVSHFAMGATCWWSWAEFLFWFDDCGWGLSLVPFAGVGSLPVVVGEVISEVAA